MAFKPELAHASCVLDVAVFSVFGENDFDSSLQASCPKTVKYYKAVLLV